MAQIGKNGLFRSTVAEAQRRFHESSLIAASRQLCCGWHVWSAMTHASLRPMDAFDPTEPAILHDRLTDTIITWTADQADDYKRASRPGPEGTVAWKTYLFDGWGNVLGG
jgi:hypothetical protein